MFFSLPIFYAIFGIGLCKTKCFLITGLLKCPTDVKMIRNVQIDLYDDDALPMEEDDLMGRTWSDKNGHFRVTGCGSDFGPINTPDPYLYIEHRCPHRHNNNTDPIQEGKLGELIWYKSQHTVVLRGENEYMWQVCTSWQIAIRYYGEQSGFRSGGGSGLDEKFVMLAHELLPLITMIRITSGQFFFPATNTEFTFLTEADYRNSLLLPQVQMMRRTRSLYNDMRIANQRFKRGGGVAVLAERDKWPNGRVPYILSSAYTSAQRAVFAKAFDAYAKRTCIRFVPKSPSDRDYIVIQKLDGCYADFSRVGGRQQVSLADECVDYATIIHELMHVIGFIHEHQREDRDNYVSIVYKNVIPGANTDFDKLSNLGLSYYGENYDYMSIMHYEATEGSRNGKNTIEAKNPHFTPIMGKASDFSASDLRRVNRAYKCSRI